MNKVFLDKLPMKKGNIIDWKKVSEDNIHVPFIYYDLEGYISIKHYDKGKLNIQYKEYNAIVSVGHFKECKLGSLLNKHIFFLKNPNLTDVILNINDIKFTGRGFDWENNKIIKLKYNNNIETINIIEHNRNNQSIKYEHNNQIYTTKESKFLKFEIGFLLSKYIYINNFNWNSDNYSYLGNCDFLGFDKVDWELSCKNKRIIPFKYKDISSEIQLIKNNKDKTVVCLYEKKEYIMFKDSLIRCALGTMLDKVTSCFKIRVGHVIKNEYCDIEIVERKYRNRNDRNEKQKIYRYKCNKCKWDGGWIEEHNLLFKTKHICSCCRGRIVVKGVNDIKTTLPHLVKYFKYEEDSIKYTQGSKNLICIKCPICGSEKRVFAYSLKKLIYFCDVCGDGISYPEKFIYSMLEQLNIDIQTQLSKSTFKWCNKYRYDFYIPSLNMIIETHGRQHYEQANKKWARSLEQEQENDKSKRELSLKNGIDIYIELDCRESNLDWIKNSILNSELNNLFDLSKIDWLKCEEFALGNLVKEVCELYIKHNNISKIANMVNISTATVSEYLLKGNKFGWCDYKKKGRCC